jgi:GH15 family glucan-1,4-alpha-glucosidase
VQRPSSDEYPIKDYALIGNCETAALINPDGGIDWLCLPAFDSPSFFGALLDRQKGGEFFIRPGCTYRVEREYVDDSAILKTRFLTEKGAVQLLRLHLSTSYAEVGADLKTGKRQLCPDRGNSRCSPRVRPRPHILDQAV